jgi:hypothetical protein
MFDLTNKVQNFVANRFKSFIGPNANQDSGVRQPAQTVASDPVVSPTSAPSNAPAAPSGNQDSLFVGLVEALNTYQLTLAKQQKYDIADVYEIKFNPVALGAATLKKPGSTDRSKTAGKNVTSAKQALDADTDKVDNNSQTISIQAGMQVVQAIDQILRNSSFASDQALQLIDPVTQKTIANPKAGSGTVVWYKVSVQATDLGYDRSRRDHAYRMTYLITPYAVSNLETPFYPKSRYRGSHKSYNYWFTGRNTQIINFEQTYNNLYTLIITGEGPVSASRYLTHDYRDQYSYTAMPTSTQRTGQVTGSYTNNAVDSLTDFFYDPTSLANATLRIVGDPAWLQQGEASGGINNGQFTFAPFNADGSINYDSQQVVFDVSWNQPQDYDFSTGVMNVNNQKGLSRQNNTYQALFVKSFFNKGRFEQELTGQLILEHPELEDQPQEVATSAAAPVAPPPAFEEGFALNEGLSGPRSTGDTPNIVGNRRLVKTFIGPNPNKQ